MIRALYAAWLEYLNVLDGDELRDRCIDGSASDKWTAMALEQISARQQQIDNLRRPRPARLKEQRA